MTLHRLDKSKICFFIVNRINFSNFIYHEHHASILKSHGGYDTQGFKIVTIFIQRFM